MGFQSSTPRNLLEIRRETWGQNTSSTATFLGTNIFFWKVNLQDDFPFSRLEYEYGFVPLEGTNLRWVSEAQHEEHRKMQFFFRKGGGGLEGKCVAGI